MGAIKIHHLAEKLLYICQYLRQNIFYVRDIIAVTGLSKANPG